MFKLRKLMKNKVVSNASWIICCRIIQSILTLVVGMMTARYLGPSNYGLINYAASIVSFMVPIMQLGLNNIMVQELINAPEKEGEILGTSLLLSVIMSGVCMVGVFMFTAVVNAGETETILVCVLYSINLLFQGLEMIQYWFQSKYKAKYTMSVSLIAYVLVSAYKIYLLATQKSIYWFALSNAIDYMLISLTLICIYKKLGGQRFSFSEQTAKAMVKKSSSYILSSLMVTIFAQTDRIMLKLMLSDAATGYYTAATACVGITTFIYTAIVDSARPSIFSSLKSSKEKFEINVVRLYSAITYISLFVCAAIVIFAPWIISILYGSEYNPSISALRIVVWYSTFSYYGVVRNIWILAEGKQKLLIVINLLGALANVVLNAIFIPVMGVNGAALASLITQFFTNVIVGWILKPIRRNNYLIMKGLNPKLLVELIRKI